ncbi:thermonuclease family protein [Marinobacterium jannaschii]|uniref:thermonuclease family protein n=1 Tax=Marinobacterium jannaschii TaxID=64970 RepID=UPI00047F88FA|nr:thermonuclease family protein [Marinobacterium jannaschii]
MRGLLLGLLACSSCTAGDFGAARVSEIVSVYDADTFRVTIEGWPLVIGENMPVRVKGIDAPEIRGKCEDEKRRAREARNYTRQLLESAEVVELRSIERGKYFRLLADVYTDGESLAEKLIGEVLARPYDGGKRQGWCKQSIVDLD